MKRDLLVALGATMIIGSVFAPSVFAGREAGDWIFRAGMTNVNPKQSNGSVADLTINVDDATTLSLTGVYMFTPNLGIELLASLPFEHDVNVGGVQFGSTKQLPPTLNLQYYGNASGNYHPYIGAGVNYTDFFSQKTTTAGQEVLTAVGASDWSLDAS